MRRERKQHEKTGITGSSQQSGSIKSSSDLRRRCRIYRRRSLRTPREGEELSMEDMKEGVEFAHAHGVKVYVTANILAHNQDLEGVRAYFAELKEIGPDALIISDPGVYRIAMEVCPEIERHISTQANNTNYGTYQFWYEQGAKRVVTARELSLAEIKEIREYIPEEMEIETFIHGAMCISYSGRCLLSNYFTGRDANQAPAPIRAGGSMRSWKSPDRGSICRCMRMREGRISLTRKIFV